LTNLPATRYRLDMIYRAYKWRWQVELLFKEWKSYANLHAFDTENAAIVEGLMWTAIAAAALKRFLASMTQLLAEVPMSTRKVAMCAVHVLGDIVQALQSGDVPGLYAALEAAGTYLACHAQRAHPKRDRHIGRSQLGLEPLFGSDDVIEFAEAAYLDKVTLANPQLRESRIAWAEAPSSLWEDLEVSETVRRNLPWNRVTS
jgi:hypothetical protein